MGHAARSNPRSRAGGKPAAYCAFQRAIRAARTFGDDSVSYSRWLDSRDLNEMQRAAMERIWSELHPAPLVTLARLDEVPVTLAYFHDARENTPEMEARRQAALSGASQYPPTPDQWQDANHRLAESVRSQGFDVVQR